MTGYVPGEQPAPGERVVKLNTNESPFPPSPAVMAAIRDLEPERLRVYPPPTAHAFREAAASLHGVAPENVLAGNGSDDVLTIVTRAFVPPGGRVASPWPTYSLYPVLCEIQGAHHVRVDWDDEWSLPVSRLLAVRADAIYLANPNAPSGTASPPEEIAELARRFKGLLVVDEAYVDYADRDCVTLLADHPNLLISRTLSKGYALAGLRFGYALAHEEVIAAMMKVKDSYNTDALGQVAAVAALADRDYAARMWQHVRDERARLTLELQLMGLAVAPSQANFVLARHPDYPDAGVLYDGLRKQGVLVRHWNEPGLQDAIRITIGTSQENNALVAALNQLLGKPETAGEPG